MPYSLGWKVNFTESGLEQVHNPLPVACLLIPLTCCCCKTPLEMLCPYLRWLTQPVAEENPDWPLDNPTPLGERFVYDKQITPHQDNPPPGGRGGVHLCRSLPLSDVISEMDTQEGGGGRLVAGFYHPWTRRHTSFTRRGLDARSESTASPDSASCRCLSTFRRTLIFWPNVLVLSWSSFRSLWRATRVSMALEFSAEIQGACRLYVCWGLGMAHLRSADR